MPDDLDTTATIEAAPDTVQVGSVQTETPTAPALPDTSPSVTGTAPAAQDTPPNPGSLRTDTSANQQPQRQIPDPANWEQRHTVLDQRYRNLQAEYTRRNQAEKELRQQFQGVNPEDVRSFREQQAKAHQAGLPMWNREHPQHGQFGALKARWQQTQANYQTAIAEAPVERHEALRQQFLAGFSQQERDTLAAHGRHKQEFGEQFAEDPKGTIASIIREEVGQIIEQREQQTQLKGRAESSVGQWFQKNPELVASQRDFIQESLQAGIPWQVTRLQAQVNFLESKLSRSHLTAQSADERNRLARTRANVTRDPNTAQEVSYDQLVQMAARQGVVEGGPKWMEFLAAHGQ